MDLPFGGAVVRERRTPVADPYNPARTVPGSWDDPDRLPLEGAWVGSSSSTSTRDASRKEILTAKSLYCQPDADVLPGDRIRIPGYLGQVEVRPSADINPFTGWQPLLEVPLEEVTG